jgi:hypothetical protein
MWEQAVGAPVEGRKGFLGKCKSGRDLRKTVLITGKEKSFEG